MNINYVNEFLHFLAKHKIVKSEEGKAITHTAFGDPWGSFNIEGLDEDKFLNLYKKVLNRVKLHMIERPKKVSCLVIDLDFKFDEKYKRRQYINKDITYIVNKFNEKIRKYFSVSGIQAFVFEKD